MGICTRGAGPRWVWHSSGAGVGLDLHPWVHPHPTQDGNGRGCGFQSAPMGPHWVPVYSPCTTILGPETHGHPKPAPKSAGSRNPPQNPPQNLRTLDGRRPVKTRGHPKPALKPSGCGCSFPPTGVGFHPSTFWGGAGFWSTHPEPASSPSLPWGNMSLASVNNSLKL
jgi:hypothetical protein